MTAIPDPIARRSTIRPSVLAIFIVFSLALLTRGAWLTIVAVNGQGHSLRFPDEMDYWSIGESIAYGEGMVGEHGFRALRMPLFPAYLSLFAGSANGLLIAKAVQCAIGALAAVLVLMLGTRVGGSRVGLVAGVLVAVDPFLVFFSSLLLTETIYITMQCLFFLVAWKAFDRNAPITKTRWIVVGLVAAACVLIREASVLPCLALIGLMIVVRRDRSAIVGGGIATLVFVLAMCPWAVRNQQVTGHLCWLTHRGGISLYDGVGPQATGEGDLADVKNMPAVRHLGEKEWNDWFMRESIRSIRDDAMRIAKLALVKIARTWSPVPNAREFRSSYVRLVSVGWTLPVYVLAVWGCVVLLRRNRSAVVALLIPALTVLLMHAVFVGSVRYRLVAMPNLELLAAIALASFGKKTIVAKNVRAD